MNRFSPERCRALLRRALYPGWLVVLLCTASSAVLLVAVLGQGLLQDSPIVYFIYSFSAYSLVILCVALQRWGQYVLLPAVNRQPLVRRYRTDLVFKSHLSLYLSLLLNLLYAVFKLVSGIWYGTVWLITLGIYYLFLLCMRCLLAHYLRRVPVGANLRAEYRRCRACGIVMALMNLALMGVIVLVLRQNRTFHYPGSLIYAMALYTFCAVASARVNLVKLRRQGSPVLSAANAISLAAALVSMLSLETAMLTEFGSEDDLTRQLLTGFTGGAVCLIILLMALVMILKANRQLRLLDGSGA